MMDDKTKKALEELQEAINCGGFDEYFKDEQRIIDYLNGKVRKMVVDITITPELESKVVNWFNKRKSVFYKHPNLWYGLLNIVIAEGTVKIEGKHEGPDKFLVSSIAWRGYNFKQYWLKEDTVIIIFRDDNELLRM